MFDHQNAQLFGSKGGKSKAAEKQRAARKNGKQGGRPPSRTLAERLLGRKLGTEELMRIEKAYWQDLFGRERQVLEDHFKAERGLSTVLETTAWRRKSGRMPTDVQYVVKKFRLSAAFEINKSKPTKPPKPYVVEWQMLSPSEEDAWRAYRPNSPRPPRPRRIWFAELPEFSHFVRMYAAGQELTVEYMQECGGAAWTEKRAAAALKFIRSGSAAAAALISPRLDDIEVPF